MTSFEKAVELIEKNDVDGLKRLIEEDPDIIQEKDEYNDNLLHYAVGYRNIDMILHTAVSKSNREIVKLLLDHGADPNARDRYGWTVLHYTIRKRDLELTKLLLEYGAEVNSSDNSKIKLLFYAVERDDVDIVRLLLDYGADPNARDSDEKTVLHVAIRRDSINIAKLLILNNANPYLKNDEGRTPLDYIEDSRVRNELLFIFHNREKILEELKRQKNRGVEYD